MWLCFISIIALITRRNYLGCLFTDLFTVYRHPLQNVSYRNAHRHHLFCLLLYLSYLPSDYGQTPRRVLLPPSFSISLLSTFSFKPLYGPSPFQHVSIEIKMYANTLEESPTNPTTTLCSLFCDDSLLPNPVPWFSACPWWELAGGIHWKEDFH